MHNTKKHFTYGHLAFTAAFALAVLGLTIFRQNSEQGIVRVSSRPSQTGYYELLWSNAVDASQSELRRTVENPPTGEGAQVAGVATSTYTSEIPNAIIGPRGLENTKKY
jgi:hypothetical protein